MRIDPSISAKACLGLFLATSFGFNDCTGNQPPLLETLTHFCYGCWLDQATSLLMKTSKAKPMQQYLSLWRECKANGSLPLPPSTGEEREAAISENTTIYEILQRMARIGMHTLFILFNL